MTSRDQGAMIDAMDGWIWTELVYRVDVYVYTHARFN
jgi:hypothetical protein